MCQEILSGDEFSPIFIVGAPRSGTTMLAVLLDRHSSIAIPPETQFFTEYANQQPEKDKLLSKEEMVDNALSFARIGDMGVSRTKVLELFQNRESTFQDLFQSILEVYAIGQRKPRAGEKSPKHLEHVPELLDAYPNAKIICIVRDGRDVVRSLLKVPWAEPKSTRRLELFCVEWRELVSLALTYKKNIQISFY